MSRSSFRIRFAPPVLVIVISLAASSLLAQPAFEWPSKPKNIKVLPKDMTKEQLSAIMTGFTRSLGVRCPYCHVGEEGKPLTTFDFPSDAKPQKQIARDMYLMLGHVNEDLKRMKLVGSSHVNMWCHTCHHGHPRPTTLSEELMAVYEPSGIDSTLASYQRLRTRFYGRDAYDFSEGSLIDLAVAVSHKGNDQDAIRILKLNVEQHPQSLRARTALAQTYEELGQKEMAVEEYRKVLEIDPQNQNARRKLEALQGAPK